MARNKGSFADLVGPGENPNGIVVYTPNGTNVQGRGADGDQLNWWPQYDGPRWSRESQVPMILPNPLGRKGR